MKPRWICVLSSLLCVSLASGCGPPPTPEEEIESLRVAYTAELMGFQVAQDPTQSGDPGGESDADADADADGDGDADGDEPEGDGDGGGADPAPVAVSTEVLLDILISTSSGERVLEGLTLDLTQIDAEQVPLMQQGLPHETKANHKIWIATPTTSRGVGSQVTETLSDVDYAPGDAFHVEVRVPIDPAERSQYREFDSLPQE